MRALATDHAVGAEQKSLGNNQTQGFRRLEIDVQLKLGRLFDREIGRRSAFQILSTWVYERLTISSTLGP